VAQASEARVSLLSSPEWNKFLRYFELADGFGLIILLIGDTELAGICREEFDLWLRTRDWPTLNAVEIVGTEAVERLPERLLDIEPPAGPLWVAAVGARELYEDGWRRCAMKLNRVRDSIAHRFSTPLILVGPPWIREILRDNAPDFWSIRAFVAELSLPSCADITAPVLLSDAEIEREWYPDPELALGQADKLRGKPGLEAELSDLLNRAAVGLMHNGRPEQARQALAEAIRLNEGVSASEPRAVERMVDLSYSYQLAGDIAGSKGNADEALEAFDRAIQVAGSVLQIQPNSTTAMYNLVTGYSRAAELTSSKSPERARSFYERCIPAIERAMQQASLPWQFYHVLQKAYRKLGDLSIREPAKARDYYSKALRLSESVFQSNPTDKAARYDLAASYARMADVMRRLGLGEEATYLYRKSIAIFEELVRENPKSVLFRTPLAFTLVADSHLQQVHRGIEMLKQLNEEGQLTPNQRDLLEALQPK
jgi:tetratricopeptide (TPR) repeat protein